jgi:hypothetical protein
MLIKALLMVLLAMGALFAWRARAAMPGVSWLAALAAGAAALFLLRSPLLALCALAVAGVLIYRTSRPS